MQFFLIKYFKRTLLLTLVIVISFSMMITNVFPRGYGSGDGNGQNYSDYVSMEKIKIFESYDINRDGYLIPDEIIVMKIPYGLFNKMDLNNNGKLNRDEFSKMLDIM